MPLLITALLLLLLPLPARAVSSELAQPPHPIRVDEHHDPLLGRGLKLTFQPLRPLQSFQRFSLDEASTVVSALEAEFQLPRHPGPHMASPPLPHAASTLSPAQEERLLNHYESLFGPSSMPHSGSLQSARWFQALLRSPRYMDEGVREAALKMFNSPTVLLSVDASLMLYALAWAAPEPLFSKGFAATITLWLLMTYTAAELHSVGVACLNLYRDAEAATTEQQLEAAAARFGRAIGAVGLRVLVTLAGAKLTRSLPEVPKGGLWSQLSPPRFAFAGAAQGGFKVGSGARAQVSVADGTVVLMSVSATTVAQALASASASRTTGDCREPQDKGDAKGHHIATNKNDKSDSNGGPWTPRFKQLFDQAGMSLDDPANIIYLIGHVGPHPAEYHLEVFSRIQQALEICDTQSECNRSLVKALNRIATEVCTPGSKLNKLATRKP